MESKQKTKILCICAKGMNRSKYLAGYLRRKGYSTRYGGIDAYDAIKPITQEDLNWANLVIVARPRHEKILRQLYNHLEKKTKVLDVSDSKEAVPGELSHLKGLDYEHFHKKWTYPNLRKAIKPYLPMKK